MHFSIDRTVHTTAFDKPVVDHWLERKIAQTAAGSTEKDRSDDRPLQRRARYRLSYIPLHVFGRQYRYTIEKPPVTNNLECEIIVTASIQSRGLLSFTWENYQKRWR